MTRPPIPPVLPGLGAGPAFGTPRPAFDIEVLLASAIQAHDAGRTDEADRGYRLLMTLAPRDARMSAHLAVLLLEQGRGGEALPLLDQSLALDPNQAGMLVNKGNALIALGRFPEAIVVYGQAIALQDEADRAAGWLNLGVYLQSLDRDDDAADAYLKAIELDPDMPQAWGNLGIARLVATRAAEAVEALDKAVALDPDYTEAWTNRGTALQASGRLEEAIESFDRALALRPDLAAVWTGRSNALHEMGRAEESIAASAQAVTLDPLAAAAWNNRGMVLQALGRLDEARVSFDRAIALKDEDFPDALWNKALLLITVGEYEEGWKLAEWRWKRPGRDVEPLLDLGAPVWLGETSPKGKRVLIHAEQGLGDTICMARYIPKLAARGAIVTVSVPEPLVELIGAMDGVAQAIGHQPTQTVFDLRLPTMSLPAAMGTKTRDDVPAEVPYLHAPAASRALWAERLGPKTRRRIGLAWSGNPTHKNDHNRSIPLAALLPLLEADAEFHSVQKDYRPADLELLKADGRIADHSAELNSFSDTAALMEEMDLMITVCTSTTHLAGALGRPMLVLLTRVPDYRWGLEGSDSAWYPTARLLRQTTTGDWTPVIAQALAALNA